MVEQAIASDSVNWTQIGTIITILLAAAGIVISNNRAKTAIATEATKTRVEGENTHEWVGSIEKRLDEKIKNDLALYSQLQAQIAENTSAQAVGRNAMKNLTDRFDRHEEHHSGTGI